MPDTPSAPADAPPAVILAGGRARRMGGGDKVLRVLHGRTLLAHVQARLAPQAGALALNANGDPARFADTGLPVLPDPVAGRPGPLAGVLAAMGWAAGLGAADVVTVPGDTPFLPADLVARLCAAAVHGAPVLAATRGASGRAVRGGMARHPTCALWPVALHPALEAALADGTTRVVDWADAQGARTAVFPEPRAFFNINTPDDLARAGACT